MKTKLFVGNLNFDTKEDELRKLFEPYGQIESITIVTDKRSGRSKGYGFVQMIESLDAAKALELSGREFMGRDIVVTEADSPGEGESRRNRSPRGGSRRFKGGRDNGHPRSNRSAPSKREVESQKQGWWSRLLKVFGGGASTSQPARSQHTHQGRGHGQRPQQSGRRNFRRRPHRNHDA